MTDAVIAGTHGLRVTATWLTAQDLHPTYAGLLIWHTEGDGTPTYAGLPVDYATYRDLLDNITSGIDQEEDLSCDVSGIRINRGRRSIGEAVKAGTLSMTLNDFDGHHDPRNSVGPTRTGSKITVEVDCNLRDEWVPIFTGFVESWTRRIDAGEGDFTEVQVDATDAFTLFGRAVALPPTTTTVYPNDVGSQRINHLLTEAGWVAKWGTLDVTGGYNYFGPTDLSGVLLDAMQDTTLSEDGIFYAKPDGTVYWYDRYWRGLRTPEAAVIDVTGKLAQVPGEPPILCPSNYVATDDDLDLVNRAIVWRSVELDPDVPDPSNPGNFTRPDPVKYSYDHLKSLSQHGVLAHEYADLPHRDNVVSDWLAQRMLGWLSGEANRVGDFEIPLVKRYADAKVVVGLDWGDQMVLWDDTITGTPERFLFELVGLEHDITPDDWTATIHVDHWVGSTDPPLGVVNGTPGYFTPAGANIPDNLTNLIAHGALGESTAWPPGHFVWLEDGTRASWNGSTWVNGALGDPTGVLQGRPGQFQPVSCVIPLNFQVLVAIGALGQTVRWTPGRWVDLADGSDAWWDGFGWKVGVTPTEATGGTPGTYNPPESTFATVASLRDVIPVPSGPWPKTYYVPLTGPEGAAHWNGWEWVPFASPGYGDNAGKWGPGQWGRNTWYYPPPNPGVWDDPDTVWERSTWTNDPGDWGEMIWGHNTWS